MIQNPIDAFNAKHPTPDNKELEEVREYTLTILGYTIPFKPELFETHERIGWKLYALIFFYTYTIFSIFLTTYIWLLVNVLGFRVTGTLLGIWGM